MPCKVNGNLPDNPENSDLSSDESDVEEDSDAYSTDEDSQENKEVSEWSKDISSFRNEFDFEQSPSINIFSIPNKKVEKYFFMQFFTEDLIDLIVRETNNYSYEKDPELKHWTDTNFEEIEALIGMFIMMGIHKLPRIRNYWSNDAFLRVEGVSNVMTVNRFEKL